MKFELTNKQREVFGIKPIDSNWDIVELNEFSKIYFDNDDIVRRLISYENGYIEREYDIQTKKREFLKPKTNRGRLKKLSYSTILNGPKPINVGFTYFKDHYACNTNFNVDRTLFNSIYINQKLSWEELNHWINNISNSMTKELIEEVKDFQVLKRKKVKYKPGDIFAFRIDASTYGYGQILLDINKIRNKFKVSNNASLSLVFGASVLARIFSHTSKNKIPSVEKLMSSIALPSIILRDNQIHFGEYGIVEYNELEESNFDYPISFGLSNNLADPNHYLNYGFITKTCAKYLTPREFLIKEGENNFSTLYRNNGSMGFIPFTLYELQQTQAKGLNWFWENAHYYSFEHDLRNPKNSKIRNKIFKHFQLNPMYDYDQMRRENGILKTLEIINETV